MQSNPKTSEGAISTTCDRSDRSPDDATDKLSDHAIQELTSQW